MLVSYRFSLVIIRRGAYKDPHSNAWKKERAIIDLAGPNEYLHLVFCWIFQMASLGMLEK